MTSSLMPLDTMNLHDLAIELADSSEVAYFEDLSRAAPSGGVVVYFQQLEAHLIQAIRQADCVVGCVAWLTHPGILAALAAVPHGVQLIVQKEDFLRPDLGQEQTPSPAWRTQLQAQYAALQCSWDRYAFPPPLCDCSVASDPGIEPVRCVGNVNRDQAPAHPRMHHKFLVLCRVSTRYHPWAVHEIGATWGSEVSAAEPEAAHDWSAYTLWEWEARAVIVPSAVWTGSFNCTITATWSLDNALYLTIPAVVEAYYREWAQIAARSEPLDWQSEWAAPEWRIGT
jgi:hypothetical protein